MKTFTKRFATLTLIATLALSSLSVGAATVDKSTSPNKNPDNTAQTTSYQRDNRRTMHHMNSSLTDEEYQEEVEKYRKERREILQEKLNQDLKDGLITREEADLYLSNFDSMGEYAGSHMMGSSSRMSRHSGMMNNDTTRRGYGHCH